MKKKHILYKLLLALTVVFVSNSCKQSEFDENYYDPEKSVEATLEGLFTGFLYNHSFENRNTILPRYWNLRTFQTPMPGKYSQTVGYLNSNGRYELGLSYAEQRWDYFYNTHISGYRNMEKKFSTLSEEEQKANLPFMEIAKILLYDQAAQMIDLWGDIPFTEAGKVITLSGELSRGKFDSGQELYSFFLDDLKRVADYLNSVQIDPITQRTFGVNDIYFKGELNKWKLYANSLRLRLAMRISNVEENKAKTIVSEILGNQTAYPVINSVSENLAIKAEGEILRSIVGKHEGGIRGGLIGELAPGKMINDIMSPAKDPRLHVLFSKNKNGNFVGVNESWNEKDKKIQ